MSGCSTVGNNVSTCEREIVVRTEKSAASLAILNTVSGEIRTDWTREEVKALYEAPLLELVFKAGTIHRLYHDPQAVQQCTLLSVKTGGCSEDCSYCPQSARYKTGVEAEKLMDPATVYAAATLAKEAGSTRFCMGAAWREVTDGPQFDKVIDMVEQVASLGMEVCVTLGMLTPEQAKRLADAGVTAYNHNLDTGEQYYDKIITTRTYQDRLSTLQHVRDSGMTVCCGGIVGMGESDDDRIDLLHTLSTLPRHPESVPINALVPVEGTPLADRPPVQIWEMIKMIATARIVMPKSFVRLSAGRLSMSMAEQALCFMAGANSIFTGEKLLTTGNPGYDEDRSMMDVLGLTSLELETRLCE